MPRCHEASARTLLRISPGASRYVQPCCGRMELCGPLGMSAAPPLTHRIRGGTQQNSHPFFPCGGKAKGYITLWLRPGPQLQPPAAGR